MEVVKATYTIKELKEVMNIGINQAYDLVASGAFPVKHVGKKIVIPIKTFEKWLHSEEVVN